MSFNIFLFTKVSLILSHPPSFRKSNVQIKMWRNIILLHCFFSELCFLFYLLLSSFLCTKGSRINLEKVWLNVNFFLPMQEKSLTVSLAMYTILYHHILMQYTGRLISFIHLYSLNRKHVTCTCFYQVWA